VAHPRVVELKGEATMEGISVLLNYLSGNEETVAAYQATLGKTIERVWMEEGDPGLLRFLFTDGTGAQVFDDGRSCCETRYMTTDDNLGDFAGATFLGIVLRKGPDIEGDYSDHEQQFLLVNTSLGTFTMVTHNEHNGYYGGFAVVVRSE
jgi:hypothetical protein